LFITSIKKQSTFVYLNKKGRKVHSPYFILIYQKNFTKEAPASFNKLNDAAAENFIALGMKVTKKIGNAVVRNKIKRRSRHLIRLMSKDLRAGKHAIVIIPKSGFEKIEFTVLQSEFNKAINSQLH
jgi:ribonuclease P protein component